MHYADFGVTDYSDVVKGAPQRPKSRTIELERQSALTLTRNKSEFGQALFKCGFREQTRAGSFIDALWAMEPLNGVFVFDEPDRVIISFGYMRRRFKSSTDVANYRQQEVMVDTARDLLMRKLQLIVSPFTLEVSEEMLDKLSGVRLVLIKQSVLTVLNETTAWISRKPNDWSSVFQEVAELAESACRPDAMKRYATEAGILQEVRNAPKSKLDLVEIKDYWDYHRASWSSATEPLHVTRFYRAHKQYEADVYARYRFMIVHDVSGKSHITVLRKTLD